MYLVFMKAHVVGTHLLLHSSKILYIFLRPEDVHVVLKFFIQVFLTVLYLFESTFAIYNL